MKNKELLTALLVLGGCAQTSSDPIIEELIKTRAPTFQGASSKTYIVPSNSNLIDGECDPISKALEYSFNNSTWTEYPGGCTTGAFSINVISNPRKRLYVRAKTKTGYTSTAEALVMMTLPPTSPDVAAVVSSRSDQDGEAGALNALTYFSTGDSSDNGLHRAHFNITGSTYGQ